MSVTRCLHKAIVAPIDLGDVTSCKQSIKAKFHYASWFEAGSKLVADRLEAGRQLRTCLRPPSNQLQTS